MEYCNVESVQALLSAPPDKVMSIKGLSTDEYILENIISMIKKQKDEEAFYLLDLGVVIDLIETWKRNLPMVQPFYAVKCNPHPDLLATLVAHGSSFDCASRSEIESILALGVSPDRIIYANPCKGISHIKYAAEVGVNLTTFESLDEIEKIRKLHTKCSLLIRIKAPDESGSRWPMSSKYGALPEEVPQLLQAAQTAGLKVAGVSFHIGSKSHNSQAYKIAIEAAKAVFQEADRLYMPPMYVLNIGGGFVSDALCFEAAAAAVNAAVDKCFSEEGRRNLTVIAEPGRFFAETAFTLVTNIIGKRVRGKVRQYWINEGFYGSMMRIDRTSLVESCIFLKCISNNSSESEKNSTLMICGKSNGGGAHTYSSTVFGATCDPIDKVLEDHQLPELEVNDWLVFRNMGAYTSSCSNNFNGFGSTKITYIIN
ncbi:PREDICTED: ornithine decarboxylase-like [Fragaria vesca subsp. vesca]|uniref:ornithine decarboxylase-like n=1 Tax=Fragaria vesca subsp. vesca TaxID=101020 RepID=UPI0002C2F9AA|nr:PREDICTED: ornithine decarboxylase-like [Fragaria vesca subsp. vesca]